MEPQWWASHLAFLNHWSLVSVAMVTGAAGGLVRHMVDRDWPSPDHRLDRRIIKDIAIGVCGGVLLVEGSRVPPLFLGLIGGYAGATLIIKRVDEYVGLKPWYNKTDKAYKEGFEQAKAEAEAMRAELDKLLKGGNVNGGTGDGGSERSEPTAIDGGPASRDDATDD